MPRVLVANALDSSLGFYDATTRKPLKSLKVGKSPHGIGVGRNRKFCFVANTGEDSVSVVDVIRMSETARVTPDGLREPAGITALADGRRLLITSKTLPEAYVVDTGRNGAMQKIDLPGPAVGSMAPVQGGKRVHMAVPDEDRLVCVDPSAAKIVEEHPLPGRPMGIGCARDQRNLLVTLSNPPRLVVFDPSVGSVVREVEVGIGPTEVKAHPYRNAAFVLTAYGVQPVDLDEGKADQPIPVGVRPNAFDIARAGKVLYVANTEGNTLAVVEADKRNIRDTWETGHHPTAVVFIA